MNTLPIRPAALTAGVSLAVMAVISALGIMVALPAGNLGVAALAIQIVSMLDVVIGVSLYPVLASAGRLLAGCAATMRIAYAALFATAAGSLVGTPDVERFQATWDLGLFLFGVHLLLVGAAMLRGDRMPAWIGVLVAIAGAGYLIDAASVAITPATPLTIGEVAFVGEIVLLIWLIGWGGRHPKADAARTRWAASRGIPPVRP